MNSRIVKKRLSRVFGATTDWMEKHPVVTWIGIVLVVSCIFVIRNTPAFTIPNFYAEDATVLFENAYTKNPVDNLTTAFNGYLITGLYILAYLSLGVNVLMGSGLEGLPVSAAIVSCLFMGIASSLPFILFRKNLGVPLALLAVIMTAFVPIASYDYAIIGTISNLKFVFLYVATMLVVYRLVNPGIGKRRVLVIDGLLLLCAITNATVAFLLPVMILPQIVSAITSLRKKHRLELEYTFPFLSACVLVGLGVVYTALAILKGIPKFPGYLDSPYNLAATLPLAERTTFFAFTHPVTPAFNSYFVAVSLLVGFVALLWYFKNHIADRYVLVALIWAMFIGTVLFAINRPGIGELYLNYLHKGGPDQFFMAQNMVFIFLVAWVCRGWVESRTFKQAVMLSFGLILYALLAFPLSTSFGRNSEFYYQSMQPIGPNLEKACRVYADKDDVIIQIYPIPYWQWSVDHDLACE